MTFEQIFYLVLGVISVLITRALIPYIKSKYKITDIEKTLEMITIAVQAAEQIYTKAGQGNIKKEYVKNYLLDHGIDISQPEINAMIESVVLEVNRWKDELVKDPPVINLIETKDFMDKKWQE